MPAVRRRLLSIAAVLLSCSVGRAAEPPEVGAKAADAAIRSEHGEVAYRKLHWLEAGPENGWPVLLLHGQRFSSAIWQKVGTLARLADAGFHAIALDLPGYGASPPSPAHPIDLAEFIAARKLAAPVVLAPSMSGRFALPLVTEHPEQVSGFVAVAPVELPTYSSALKKLVLPTLILWGEKDDVVPVYQAKDLHDWVKDSKLVILSGAGHPCYLDKPDEFNAALVEFVRSVAAKRGK